MLIWREIINGIVCCFGGNTDKCYICNKPISMVKLNSYVLCQNELLANTSYKRCRPLRYEMVHSVAKL